MNKLSNQHRGFFGINDATYKLQPNLPEKNCKPGGLKYLTNKDVVILDRTIIRRQIFPCDKDKSWKEEKIQTRKASFGGTSTSHVWNRRYRLGRHLWKVQGQDMEILLSVVAKSMYLDGMSVKDVTSFCISNSMPAKLVDVG